MNKPSKNEQADEGSSTTKSLMAGSAAVLVAVLVALAGSQNSLAYADWPLFALCGVLAFAVQWLAFVPAYLRQTEKFYDLTGSLTYIAVTLLALWASGKTDTRSLLLAGLVVIWAARLGSFLLRRIQQDGKDGRFDDIKPNPARFLLTWTLQGLWVFLTLTAVLVVITSKQVIELGLLDMLGFAVWVIGFLIEAVADQQKRSFKSDPNNKGRFIQTGLWAWSRHPNYFGEILLWVGVFILAMPILSGWQWIAIISPVFVALLLTKVSGIPMLEKRADKTWGGQADYEAYKANTPVLIPKPPQ